MTHRKTIRPAITALAAVMAMSATPLFAQTADVPAATPAPVVDSPAPAAADPVAPAPVVSTPVVETPAAADPLAAKTTSVRKTTTVKTTTAKTSATRSRPATTRVSKTTTTTTAPVAAIAAPAAALPVEAPLPAEPIVAARPTDAPVAQAPATPDTLSGMLSSDMLPIELGGLAIVVLAGGALAIRSRRRRRADEADEAAWQQEAEAVPEADAEPAMIVEPQPEPAYVEPAYIEPALVAAAAPVLASESEPKFIAPETELPEGFDISRFGPNVQDAYRGPTEDNPSLSLKTRLSRASGMDQQERKLDAEVEAVTGEPVLDEAETSASAEAPDAKPAIANPDNGGFILARTAKKPVVRPTYTH